MTKNTLSSIFSLLFFCRNILQYLNNLHSSFHNGTCMRSEVLGTYIAINLECFFLFRTSWLSFGLRPTATLNDFYVSFQKLMISSTVFTLCTSFLLSFKSNKIVMPNLSGKFHAFHIATTFLKIYIHVVDVVLLLSCS